MTEYKFPDFPEPNVNSAAGCGDSYTMSFADSTVSSTSDAGYKHTRPRNTRMISTYTFSWMGVSDDNFEILLKFYKQVGTFQSFMWNNYIDEKKYEVRFASALSGWQYSHPDGWRGILKFEVV